MAAVERPCGLITLDGNVEAGNRNALFIEAKAVDKKRTRGQMRLPEVAARLRVLAIDLNCDELNDLADEIARRPSGQRAPRTSARMTLLPRREETSCFIRFYTPVFEERLKDLYLENAAPKSICNETAWRRRKHVATTR